MKSEPGDGVRAPAVAALFGEYYYAHCCGRPYGRDQAWLEFFGRIADRIVSDLAPRTVLDAGCAWGLLVEALRARGVQAFGIDISDEAIGHVSPDVRAYCRAGSIAEPFDRRYDLVVCLEVVEHMPALDAVQAVDNLCSHTDDVLFSSSPFDLREPTHVNVHGPDVWAERFARHGFLRDIDFDAEFMTPWAARFNRATLTPPALVRRYERWAFQAVNAAREARTHALESQRAIADNERQRDEIAGLQTRIVELTTELQVRTEERDHALRDRTATVEQLAAEREDAMFERKRMAERLAEALGTIRAMERSVFWRLRTPWSILSRLWGRS